MKLDENSVIVLGGSFNPPTIAHVQLVLHALKHTGTNLGILVPSSKNYVARKCRKLKESLIFSEETRKEMLESLISPYENLKIELGEYGDDGKGRSYDTMVRIQNQYPGRSCAFIIGADVLPIIPKWHNGDAFFEEFYFVVAERNHEDTKNIIQSNPKLHKYQHKLIMIPELSEETRLMSSTRARYLLKREQSTIVVGALEKILTSNVLKIARNDMEGMMNE